MFYNLIGNSLKHSGNTRPEVLVERRHTRDAYLIRVADVGVGIDPALEQKAFEPLTRLNKTAGNDGTGLGLYMVKVIVTAHGGTIRLGNDYRSGACFQISLPRSVASTNYESTAMQTAA